MKPPSSTRLALYLLHWYTKGMASGDDVIEAARQLDEDELRHFKIVAGIAYSGETLAEVQKITEAI